MIVARGKWRHNGRFRVSAGAKRRHSHLADTSAVTGNVPFCTDSGPPQQRLRGFPETLNLLEAADDLFLSNYFGRYQPLAKLFSRKASRERDELTAFGRSHAHAGHPSAAANPGISCDNHSECVETKSRSSRERTVSTDL